MVVRIASSPPCGCQRRERERSAGLCNGWAKEWGKETMIDR